MIMDKNRWKRFSFFEKGITLLLISCILFDLFLELKTFPAIINEIVDNCLWLSIGLYAGFRLCKHEYKKALRD